MIKKHRNASEVKGEKNGEFCVQHSDGHISDAELHGSMLDNPAADATARESGEAVDRRARLSEDEFKKLYE
jgi:hypothetical protein